MKKELMRVGMLFLIQALAWVLMVIGGYALGARADAAVETATAPPIDLTQLVQAVIAVLAALITGRLVPWIKANTAQKQQAMLQAATDTAVYAAQQLYKTNVIQDRLDYAERWLEGRGYTVDRGQIEASVRRMDSARDLFQLQMDSLPEPAEKEEPEHADD